MLFPFFVAPLFRIGGNDNICGKLQRLAFKNAYAKLINKFSISRSFIKDYVEYDGPAYKSGKHSRFYSNRIN